MAVTASFFTLPAELRLMIADYVFEQPHDAVFEMKRDVSRLESVDSYSSACNLRALLVCRQLYEEFQATAYSKTTFFIQSLQPYDCIARLPEKLLRHVRKLVLRHSGDLGEWLQYPFNIECLHLDELIFVSLPVFPHRALAGLLHRLQHVQTCAFVADRDPVNFGLKYQRMVGLLLKNDHYQRYDAPGAPNIENTWWEWSFNATQLSFSLRALPAKPVMAEEEYMRRVKPHVDALMQDMEQASNAL